MRASRIAESGLKIIISPESSEALLFDPQPPLKNLLYGARQVVVNDGGKNTTEEIKGMNVCVKKGLLLLARICPHKVLPGKTGSHAKEVNRRLYTPNHCGASTPISLRLPPAIGIENQENPRRIGSQLRLCQTHITPDIDLAALKSFLLDKTIINPMSRFFGLSRSSFNHRSIVSL
jgi:hypothetical protein